MLVGVAVGLTMERASRWWLALFVWSLAGGRGRGRGRGRYFYIFAGGDLQSPWIAGVRDVPMVYAASSSDGKVLTIAIVSTLTVVTLFTSSMM